jgi:hypothetical protein
VLAKNPRLVSENPQKKDLGESQSLKAERDTLLQEIEKMFQSEATIQKEFQVQAEEIQTRQVKCGCT